jgi:hypothetical protein
VAKGREEGFGIWSGASFGRTLQSDGALQSGNPHFDFGEGCIDALQSGNPHFDFGRTLQSDGALQSGNPHFDFGEGCIDVSICLNTVILFYVV